MEKKTDYQFDGDNQEWNDFYFNYIIQRCSEMQRAILKVAINPESTSEEEKRMATDPRHWPDKPPRPESTLEAYLAGRGDVRGYNEVLAGILNPNVEYVPRSVATDEYKIALSNYKIWEKNVKEWSDENKSGLMLIEKLLSPSLTLRFLSKADEGNPFVPSVTFASLFQHLVETYSLADEKAERARRKANRTKAKSIDPKRLSAKEIWDLQYTAFQKG